MRLTTIRRDRSLHDPEEAETESGRAGAIREPVGLGARAAISDSRDERVASRSFQHLLRSGGTIVTQMETR